MKKIIQFVRPGLRGKFSLAAGLMLFVLIALILVVTLKQQHGIIWNYSMKEVRGRLVPVGALTQDLHFTMKNLYRLHDLQIRIDKKAKSAPARNKETLPQDENKGDKKDEKDKKEIKAPEPPPNYHDEYFSEEGIENAWKRMQARLNRYAKQEVTEKRFDKIKRLSGAIFKSLGRGDVKIKGSVLKAKYIKLSRSIRQQRSYEGQLLDNELRRIFQYKKALKNAFQGLDLSKYRVESLNLFYGTRFDTKDLEPWKDVVARIRKLKEQKQNIKETERPEEYQALENELKNLQEQKRRLDRVSYKRINTINPDRSSTLHGLNVIRDAFYEQSPQIEAERMTYTHDSADYVITALTLFITPAVTERAMRIKQTLASPAGAAWRDYLKQEEQLQRKFADLADKISKRLEYLKKVSPELPPGKDKEFNAQYERYELLMKKRTEMFVRARERYLEKIAFAYQNLKRRLATTEEELAKNEQNLKRSETRLKAEASEKDPKKRDELKALVQQLTKEREEKKELIKDLKKQVSDYFDEHFQVADAFEHLREAALQDHLVLRFDYDSEAYNSMIATPNNRALAAGHNKLIRDWIMAGCSEIGDCRKGKARLHISGILDGGQLFLSRSEAEQHMWKLDAAPLGQLADQELFQNTAGFTRIFFDQSDVMEGINRERREMIDIMIALGGRFIFLAFLLAVFLVRTIRTICAGADRVGQGDLSVRFESNSRDELGTLADSLNSMVSGLKEREEMRGELAAAEEIQKLLLPEQIPLSMEESLSVGHFYKAMSGVGGDYYDFIESSENEMVFCIADVSNHGVGPALVMSLMRAQLRAIVGRKVTDLVTILKELNDRLYEETPSNIFVTLLLGSYDKTTNIVKYCSAGHNKSLVYRYKTETLEELERGGMPLGAVDNEIFGDLLQPRAIKLEVGDLFFQFTDGVNEAMDADMNQFGNVRLQQCIIALGKKKPQVIAEGIARSVENFTKKKIFCDGPSELNDDIAMIAFRRIK